MFAQNKIASILFAVGLAAAIYALTVRHAVERRYRTVEIALDYQEIEQLAGATGLSVGEVLGRFKSVGATSVAIQEETIGDLIDNGEIYALPNTRTAQPVATVLTPALPALPRRLRARLEASLGGVGNNRNSGLYLFDGKWLPLPPAMEQVRLSPAGLDPHAVQAVRSAGMAVVARLVNYPGANPRYLKYELREMRGYGVRTVIFAQDQVLGFRGLIREMGRLMREHGINYGSIEFAKQKGDAGLARAVGDRLVRVHSITLPEMGIIDKRTAIERYARSVRERNIRLCYVRLYDFAAKDVVGENATYVESIANAVKAAGFSLGTARDLPWRRVPRAVNVLMAVGAIAGLLLLLRTWFEIHPLIVLALFVALCAVSYPLGSANPDITRKLIALGAALVFPLLGLTWAVSGRQAIAQRINLSVAVRAGLLLLGTIAVTAAGGAIIAGLLSTWRFMLKVDQFAGVKLAHIVPILAAAFLVSAGTIWSRGTWREQKERAASGIRHIAEHPILVWQAALAIVALGAIALLVARSGNDAGVGVSDFELKFRAILDRLLFVRPRTKEFLIGHPALYLGLAALLIGKRNWAAPLLVVGTIGLVSVVNTFCHAHTPIALSVARVGVGAIIGLVVGIILLWVSRWFTPRANGDTGQSQG